MKIGEKPLRGVWVKTQKHQSLRCPWSCSRTAWRLVEIWERYESDKCLPREGGLLDQAAYIVQAIDYCRNIARDVDAKLAQVERERKRERE